MKLGVRKIAVDREGFIKRGHATEHHRGYVGVGEPLWRVFDRETDGDLVEVVVRASSGSAARELVRAAGKHGAWRLDSHARWRDA